MPLHNTNIPSLIMTTKTPAPTSIPTPTAEFNRVIRVFRVLLKLIGCDVFDDNFHPHMITGLLAVLIACFNLSCVYTMCNSPLADIINCSSYLGVGLQGPTKLYVGVFEYTNGYNQLRRFVVDTYERIARCGSAPRQRQAARFSVVFMHIMRAYLALCLIVMSAIMSFPLVMYVALGMRHVLMLASSLPFVDYQTSAGYVFTTAFHVACVFIVLCGNATTDAYFMVLLLHTYTVHMCLDRSVEVLNVRLQQVGGAGGDVRAVGWRMRDVLRSHQEYDE